ncbi:MAG: prepilin-type N-terminal cleavage/methylation domain-containing protein [Candidatus Omnitrophota bacterium]|nr:prepilin-type N-terminal cleavage/methylation domain-containing protein [Candidatus Omnitrophota bacterium]
MLKNRVKGFTLLESLFAVTITCVLISALFFALSSGELSQAASGAKVELQEEARRLSDWINNDARQAVSWEIADSANNPNSSHIKFRQVLGWDTGANNFQLSTNYVEYSYDADNGNITRKTLNSDGSVIQAWFFNHIIQPPFYTRDSSGNAVVLNGSDLLSSRRLIALISVQKAIRGSLTAAFNITSEVKIRNE